MSWISLQKAVTAPHWLLGQTSGESSANLKMEPRLPAGTLRGLEQAGHGVESAADFDSMMGHAGAVVRHPEGFLEGAADPRSDGAVAAS